MRHRHADGARQTEESFTTKPVMKSSYSPVGTPSSATAGRSACTISLSVPVQMPAQLLDCALA